ncbi:DUF4189 domain-containing protein [Neorhizobium lilium]|uniref:DUF4189 domain-containing protein n=1 Tax=Neorhizobium lilium TaxID=2503024 RepID=A0A3S3VTX4_9HYPH|nr:DUF4189 domain-containing protein [Neorhizobium lilium]RWX81797.1 DUF4189 domain-containing protein [Neorhizobium lilium]
MSVFKKFFLAGFIAVTAASGMSAPARAWDCIAVSDEGTYGYSYNYDGKDAAVERALNECAKRTTTDSTCEIVECE